MSTKRDYYEVLGVPRNAGKDDLKKAYRKLAMQYHPDVNKDAGADDVFKEINEAYEILSDVDKRAAYDRYGHTGVQGGGAGFQDFTGFDDVFDFVEQFMGGFGGSARRRRRGPRRGADIRYDLTLTFDEAVHGVEKEIEFRRPESCDHCGGSGAEPGTQPQTCPTCNGLGEIRRERGFFVNVTTCPQCQGQGEVITRPCPVCQGRKEVQRTVKRMVRIPAGVDSDNQIRLNNEGAPGLFGGPPGHLYVVIQVLKHEFFERRGSDILLDMEINVAQAALGDEIIVPTIDGEEKLVIPPGTQSGSVFRLRGRGVPHLRRDGRADRGDQHVIAQVAIPHSLTEEQRELFKELARTLGKEVIPQRERGILSQLKNALGDVFGL